MRFVPLALALLVMAAACAPAAQTTEPDLPTLAVLPSVTPTDTPAIPTDTRAPTDTPFSTAVPTLTSTPRPTRTPRPTDAPPATVPPTLAAVGTATQAVLEAPRFSTFTPAPDGLLPTGTPKQLADVVITEAQFQEEVDRRVADLPSIDRAIVDFVPGGIQVELTALGGEALTTGIVLVTVELTGSFATIAIGDIQVNAPEPPQVYVQVVSSDFFAMMLDSLDSILKQRLGPNQQLRDIAVTDSVIEVTLLVPQS
ncbi:MAG: hypothetical protein HXY41_06085 [Chloroflexi bacterium]|nr:hypothetical protein [Chloroflexota bacterium]